MRTFLSIISISLFAVMLIFCLGCFNNYFYPMKYKDEIIEYAEESDISPALIASIINVESGFRKDIVSNKGAVGLMQIMPQTAEWICSKNSLNFDELDLKDEKTSISLGSKYLASLTSSFDNLDCAICAYNAGPTKVKSWLANEEYSKDGVKLDNIPYKETSEYLNKVKKNLRHYSSRYKV